MWNNKFEKGLSIVEVMVAAGILGMIIIIFINSNSMFMRTQQDLIKINKRDQIADLILQDISEYVKPELHPYGEITISIDYDNREALTILEANEICVRGVETQPQVEDLFAIEGVEGRYRIEEIALEPDCNSLDELDNVVIGQLITTTEDIAADTEIVASEDVLLTFLAFKKVELECFTAIEDGEIVGVDLTLELSAADIFESLEFADDETCEDPPDEIIKLVDSWKAEIDTLRPSVALATVTMSDEQLFIVTIGDVTNQTSLAKKFVQCAFAASTAVTVAKEPTINFSFPGLGAGGGPLAVPTRIMVGSENPILHFGFDWDDINVRHYNNFQRTVDPDILDHNLDSVAVQSAHDSDDITERDLLFPSTDTDNEGTGANYDNEYSCEHINASTCRQNYARHKYISVFLYRYTGEEVTVRPAGCSDTPGWDQCDDPPGHRITFEPNDLSLWFIYSEADEDNPDRATGDNPDGVDNQVGYIGFSIENLGVASMIAVFDDSGESCLGDIVEVGNTGSFKCQGGYDYNNAHDGLVIHLAEDDITQITNVTLDVVNPAVNIEGWQVLFSETDEAGCYLAQTEEDTSHDQGDLNPDCWKIITTPKTQLAEDLPETSPSSISVWCLNPEGDEVFSSFADEGYLQVGNEVIHYSGKNDDRSDEGICSFTSPFIRGIGNTVEVLRTEDDNEGDPWVIFKDLCTIAETPPDCADTDYTDDQGIHARLISGESDFAQRGAKLRIGRWADWIDNATGSPVNILIQQRDRGVFNNYELNRFRTDEFEGLTIVDNNNPGDSFDIGEKYVASDTAARLHTANPPTTVYAIPVEIDDDDGVLDGNEPAIANSQVSIINDSWVGDGRNDVDREEQNTITIPRKIELDFQAAVIESNTTVNCSQ